MDSSEKALSIMQALNMVQSWLNAKDYDKVIQGCQEILRIDPGNLRAGHLMAQAEAQRFEKNTMPSPSSPPSETAVPAPAPAPMPEPAPAPMPEPAPMPAPAPMPEPAPLNPATTTVETPDPEAALEDFLNRPFVSSIAPHNRKQVFLAMAIPAVLIILIGAGLLKGWALYKRNVAIEAALQPEIEEETGSEEGSETTEKTFLKNNEQRLNELTAMGEILENYKEKTGHYPSINAVRAVLASDPRFKTVPVDPRQGELDKAGKAFGYLYAVYPSAFGGEDQYYVLSALFEDSKGFASPWSIGASITHYPDYRDLGSDHVTFIAP